MDPGSLARDLAASVLDSSGHPVRRELQVCFFLGGGGERKTMEDTAAPLIFLGRFMFPHENDETLHRIISVLVIPFIPFIGCRTLTSCVRR